MPDFSFFLLVDSKRPLFFPFPQGLRDFSPKEEKEVIVTPFIGRL